MGAAQEAADGDGLHTYFPGQIPSCRAGLVPSNHTLARQPTPGVMAGRRALPGDESETKQVPRTRISPLIAHPVTRVLAIRGPGRGRRRRRLAHVPTASSHMMDFRASNIECDQSGDQARRTSRTGASKFSADFHDKPINASSADPYFCPGVRPVQPLGNEMMACSQAPETPTLFQSFQGSFPSSTDAKLHSRPADPSVWYGRVVLLTCLALITSLLGQPTALSILARYSCDSHCMAP